MSITGQASVCLENLETKRRIITGQLYIFCIFLSEKNLVKIFVETFMVLVLFDFNSFIKKTGKLGCFFHSDIQLEPFLKSLRLLSSFRIISCLFIVNF